MFGNNGNQFEWRVLQAGYQCIEGIREVLRDSHLPTVDRYLCETKKAKEQKKAKIYYPLIDYPSLFIEFAHLEPKEQSILQFSKKYGFLKSENERVIPKDVEKKDTNNIYLGESFSMWKSEIHELKNGVEIWEQYEQRNQDFFDKSYPKKQFQDNDVNDENFSFKVFNELIFPIVNKNLSTHATYPQLQWSSDPSKPAPRLIFKPLNLIGAMWLQFAQAIHQKANIKLCRQCGDAFIVIPSSNRKTKTYCSDSCRVKFYRSRKGEG